MFPLKNILFFFSLFFLKGTFTSGISHLSQYVNFPTYLHFSNWNCVMISTVNFLKDYSPQKSETTKDIFLKMISKKGYKLQSLNLWEFLSKCFKLLRHCDYVNFNLTQHKVPCASYFWICNIIFHFKTSLML